MAQPASAQEAQQRARKPMYEDEHSSCSVLLAKIRNEECLLSLPPHDQFRWLHRFYLVLDRIAEQHRVYKLYGGPHGFMISTGVAEPDTDHAATLLRFALHLLQASQSIRLPGQVPLDLMVVLASGPASSGLLGTTSLTYQIVGRSVSIARELLDSQVDVPFLVTSGLYAELRPPVAAELLQLGSVPLRCCPGEEEAVYGLPRYRSTQLPQQPAAAPTAEGLLAVAAEAAATPLLGVSSSEVAGAGVAAAAAAGLPCPRTGAAGQAAQTAPTPALCPVGPAAASCGATEAPSSLSPMRKAAAARLLLPQQPAEERRQAVVAAAVAAAHPGSRAHSVGAGATSPMPVVKQQQPAAAEVGQVVKPQAPSPVKPKPGVEAAARQLNQLDSFGKINNSLPRNTHSSEAWLESDLLLRFDDPEVESRFAIFNGKAQQTGELAWMMLSLVTAVLYATASVARGEGIPLSRIAQFQLLPGAGALLWHTQRDAFFRYREAIWFVQRFVVLLATSLPGAFIFSQPAAMPLFAFGLCNLALEMLTRRLRLHLQLFSSVLVYVASMVLMSLHSEGTHSRALITPAYLSTHLVVTVVAPVLIAACCDYMARLSFQTGMAAQQRELVAKHQLKLQQRHLRSM